MKTLKALFLLVALVVCNVAGAQTTTATKSSKTKTTKTVKGKSANAPKSPVANSKSTPVKLGISYTFDKEKIALGRMKKTTKKTFDYIMTNTGTEDLEIEIVSGCDCTTLDWTRGVIKPGQKATINAIFDSTEKEISEKETDIDVYFKNKDKKTGMSIFKILNFTYELY